MKMTWAQLRKLSDRELIEAYERAAERVEVYGLSFFREEMFRRQVHRLTLTMAIMTGAILVLTAVNVFLVWRMG